jgi:L-threonylcarbamoyladenylate synthase
VKPLHLSVSSGAPDPDIIARAADVVRAGGIVAYATDTLYGLAVDPRNTAAVDALFALKGRRESAALPLIAGTVEQAHAAGEFGPLENTLARAFWPGPLSIVVRARPGLAAAVLGGGTTVAIRVPDHAVARALATASGCCITSTSANPSGAAPTSDPAELDADLISRVDVLLDSGLSPGGAASTVVRLENARPVLVRDGAVGWDRVLKSLE